MPRLAMDRHDDLGTHPIVHFDELRPAGVARHVHMGLALGDDARAEVRKLVHDPPDGDLVAGDDPRREDDRIAFGELEIVAARRDPAERRAGFALAAGGDDQHLAARQAHGVVEADRRREVLEVAGRLRDAQDAFE